MDIGTSDSSRWYWAKRESSDWNGPVDRNRIEQLAQEGSLNRRDLVWNESFDSWKEAKEIQDLTGLFSNPPPLPGEQRDKGAEAKGNQSGQHKPQNADSENEAGVLRPTEDRGSSHVQKRQEPPRHQATDTNQTSADIEGNIKISKYSRTDERFSRVQEILEQELKNLCGDVEREGKGAFEVSKVAPEQFGAFNRTASGTVLLQRKNDGYLIRAGINCQQSRQSAAFALLLLFTTAVGFILPIAFYHYQKKFVKRDLEQTLSEVAAIAG